MTPTANELDQPLILTGQPAAREDDCACDELIFNANSPGTTDNDCACVETQASPTAGLWENALFQKSGELYSAALPGGFTLALSPVSPSGPAVLNGAAWEMLNRFEPPRRLQGAAERKLAESGLLHPLGRPTLGPASTDIQQLTAWLHITNACNLDCPYCYVRKSSAMMSAETGKSAIEAVFRTARQRKMGQVKLKYAGGEAALHFDLVRALHAQAQQLAELHELRLHEVLLSNGASLGAAQAGWLAESGVRLMISLDGVGAAHDRLRSTTDGTGTFERIERSVDELLIPSGIRPTISITLTGRNTAGAADAVRWALARQLPVSLNFYRPSGAAGALSDLELEETAIVAGMQAAYRVFEEYLPQQPFFNGLLDRFRMGAHALPCGVGQGYVAITHEGKLAECHMRLDAPTAGGLDGDLLAAVQGENNIRNLPADEKNGCQKCLYRYYCAGGCPLETFRARGRWNAPGPNCAIYRALAPAALRLEGLRLLKNNGY